MKGDRLEFAGSKPLAGTSFTRTIFERMTSMSTRSASVQAISPVKAVRVTLMLMFRSPLGKRIAGQSRSLGLPA